MLKEYDFSNAVKNPCVEKSCVTKDALEDVQSREKCICPGNEISPENDE